LLFNKDYYTPGKTIHEIGHAALRAKFRENAEFKINFDRNIHKLRIKYLKQQLCTECFYYYPKKTMIYTDEPYLDAGLKSEYWWYCTPECVDFRLDLNKY